MRIGDIVLYRVGIDTVLPSIVTRVWPGDVLNLTVFLDNYASDTSIWRRTSVSCGTGLAQWHPREVQEELIPVPVWDINV